MAPPMYGQPLEVRHKPGIGVAVGFLGVLMFLFSFMGPAWVDAGGEELDFSDLSDLVEPEGAAEAYEMEIFAIYADFFWVTVALAATAVVFSALFVPSSKGARVAIGFLTGGMLGLAVHAADDEGTFAPRVTGALSAILLALVHGFCVFDVIGDENGPDPGVGIWIGFAGLFLVLMGCVLGTRTEKVPAPAYGYR